MRLHDFARPFVVWAACIALVLPGCSTQNQRLGADDGSDVCRMQRVALDSTGDYFGEDIVKGVAIGAVTGGLIGGLTGGNVKSALIGAAAGGALGAAGGYWRARQQQNSDQASLYRTVSSDIERDNATIDKTQLAFNQLVDCRQAEAGRIRADLRAGRISRPDAVSAMGAVREHSAGDLRLAQFISGKIQERSNDFAFANTQVNPGASAAPSQPTRTSRRSPQRVPRSPAGEVQTATLTNVAKRDQFNQSIVRVQANQSAFELS